jgi:hypothetical protein
MLGKFKSIFNKDVIELGLDEVQETVSGMNEKNQKEKVDAIRLQAASEAKKLENLIKELSKKRAGDNYVNVLKNRFCEKSVKSLNVLSGDHDDFISSLSTALHEISGISMKEFRHFHAFRDDMARIASQVKSTEARLEEFKKVYYASSQKKISDIILLSNKVKEKHVKLISLDTEINEIEKAVPFIKDSLEKNERNLSETTKKIDSLGSESGQSISSIQAEMSIIRQKISTEFGSIGKLLKKIDYENPRKYHRLQLYVSNPADAFIEDENLEIRTVLEETKLQVRREDPEKYDKVLEILRNIDFFDALRQQYRGLTQRAEEIDERRNRELIPLEKEKNHALKTIEEERAEISQLLEKRTLKSREKEKTIAGISEDRYALKEKLQDLMQRVVILK